MDVHHVLRMDNAVTLEGFSVVERCLDDFKPNDQVLKEVHTEDEQRSRHDTSFTLF